MFRSALLALATLSVTLSVPVAALALPAVGDELGTNPEAATAALAAAGCTVQSFEAEGGQIEAKCTDDATGRMVEIYIDPASGAVTNIKAEED